MFYGRIKYKYDFRADELNHEYTSTDLEHGHRSMVTAIFYRRIKPGLFPSLCKGGTHGTVLKLRNTTL